MSDDRLNVLYSSFLFSLFVLTRRFLNNNGILSLLETTNPLTKKTSTYAEFARFQIFNLPLAFKRDG